MNLLGGKPISWNDLALGFLPSGVHRISGDRLMDSTTNMGSHTIPIVGAVIEPIVNFVTAVFVNLIDFILWFVSWIPGYKQLIEIIYVSPDIDQTIPLFADHRNFITHSVLNPVFLALLLVMLVISLFRSNLTRTINAFLFLAGLTFTCHLLADSMPSQWVGFGRIHISISGVYFIPFLKTLPGFFSKL